MAKNIKQLEKDIRKFLLDIITDAMKYDFANYTAETIYKRTKSGWGLVKNKVSFGGNSLRQIEDLSPGYIKYRAGRVTGAFGAPKRSNLTFTGELLESIAASTSKPGQIEIQGGPHSIYKGDVQQLATKVSEEGRPFFGVADVEVKTIENYIKRKIRDRIRQLQK